MRKNPCSRKPTSNNDMILFLQHILLYKEKVELMAIYIKGEVNKALDRRSSFGPVFSPSYKNNLGNYHAWLDEISNA